MNDQDRLTMRSPANANKRTTISAESQWICEVAQDAKFDDRNAWLARDRRSEDRKRQEK
jgi:hypothetical protein